MTTTTATLNTRWRRFFSRLSPAPSNSFLLDRRRIFIVPSRSGLFFLLVLIIMLLASINYSNSMGYMLTFLLGSMTIVSALHTQRNLLGLRLEAGKVTPVFAGETAQFQVWLDNRGSDTRYALICAYQRFKLFGQGEEVTSLSNCGKLDSPLLPRDLPFTIDLPADQRTSITIPVAATQRGRLSLGRITLYTTFPLGLFHAWAYVHLESSTLVYPHPIGLKTLPSTKPSENLGEGKPAEGGGEDFIGYRNYLPGDSPRHVDWKVVARNQEWLIKQFGGMSAATVWLTWEDVAYTPLEAALSQLCMWILVADSQGAQYGLRIPGGTFEPNTGEQHRERCLQALALFPSPPIPLPEGEKTFSFR